MKPKLPAAAQHAQWPSATGSSTPTVDWEPYPSASGQRPVAASPTAPQATVPTGYIVLTAFFLAIAVTGFGVFIALEIL